MPDADGVFNFDDPAWCESEQGPTDAERPCDLHPCVQEMIDRALRLMEEAERGPVEIVPVQREYDGESGLKNIMDTLAEAGIIRGAKEQHDPPRRSRPKIKKTPKMKSARSGESMPSAARESVGSGESEELSKPQPYPVHIASISDEVAQQLRVRKLPEDVSIPPEWSGTAWDSLTPLLKRLLKYMYERQQADITDLETDVWGKDISDAALQTALSKANNFLLTIQHPRTLAKVRGEKVVRWQ
jgi:hypothetical protein